MTGKPKDITKGNNNKPCKGEEESGNSGPSQEISPEGEA